MQIKDKILRVIKDKAHIPVDEYMEMSLTRFDNSYYKAQNPFDERGSDFITSPEISQMFGEMLGIWVYNQWQLMGAPTQISLVEFGPGTGLLMRDMLRLLAKTELFPLVTIYMLEVNPVLQSLQKDELAQFGKDVVKEITWIQDACDLPQNQAIFISNEFLDVFPVKQFIKKDGLWQEVFVVANDGELEFTHAHIESHKQSDLHNTYAKASEGAIAEESPLLGKFMESVYSHIKEHNSVKLAIDYGYDLEPSTRAPSRYVSSLQAVSKHKYCGVFENIGECDLTTHVDFYSIRQNAMRCGLFASNTISQSELLHKLGIKHRLESLIKSNPSDAGVLTRQYKRLTDPDQMGQLFKAIVIGSTASHCYTLN